MSPFCIKRVAENPLITKLYWRGMTTPVKNEMFVLWQQLRRHWRKHQRHCGSTFALWAAAKHQHECRCPWCCRNAFRKRRHLFYNTHRRCLIKQGHAISFHQSLARLQDDCLRQVLASLFTTVHGVKTSFVSLVFSHRQMLSQVQWCFLSSWWWCHIDRHVVTRYIDECHRCGENNNGWEAQIPQFDRFGQDNNRLHVAWSWSPHQICMSDARAMCQPPSRSCHAKAGDHDDIGWTSGTWHCYWHSWKELVIACFSFCCC